MKLKKSGIREGRGTDVGLSSVFDEIENDSLDAGRGVKVAAAVPHDRFAANARHYVIMHLYYIINKSNSKK